MELWIAREIEGALFAYTGKPKYDKNCCCWDFLDGTHVFELDDDLFPEVTFENSPQKVKIKLIKK